MIPGCLNQASRIPPYLLPPTSAEAMRFKRNLLISVACNRINRYRNQHEFGIPTVDTSEDIRDLAVYLQCLRDVPQQSEFPTAIVWPQAPLCLVNEVVD